VARASEAARAQGAAVKRYGFYVRPSDGSTQFHEAENGAWVRYSDVEALQAENALRKAALETIQRMCAGAANLGISGGLAERMGCGQIAANALSRPGGKDIPL
jgi:hypothetical protein